MKAIPLSNEGISKSDEFEARANLMKLYIQSQKFKEAIHNGQYALHLMKETQASELEISIIFFYL